MRHNRSGFKLKRNVASRKALFKGMVTSIIENSPPNRVMVASSTFPPTKTKASVISATIPGRSFPKAVNR